MRTVWKYQIGHGETVIQAPRRMEVLKVGVQGGDITLWALVETDDSPASHPFRVTGTGWEAPPPPWQHIGSVFIGPFVWHVWRER